MEITTKNAIAALAAINSLIESDKTNKHVFKSSTRVRLAAIRRNLRPIGEDFDAERARLVEELGEPAKSGEGFTVKKENLKSFFEQIDGASKEVHVIQANPIGIEELGDNQIPIDVIDALIESGVAKE